jgi:F0F1-type ATP synthase assembly protein I
MSENSGNGMVLGAGFGVVLGRMFGVEPFGIVLGALLGLVLGAAIPSDEPPFRHPENDGD